METFLQHPIVQAVFDRPFLRRMETLLDALRLFERDAAERLLDMPGEVANPFQGGYSVIRRQFIVSVSLLAFELFGHVTPRVIDSLLEIKSSNADGLGLVPWPRTENGRDLSRETRLSEARRHIRGVRKLALGQSKKHGWKTRDVIRFCIDDPATAELFEFDSFGRYGRER